MNKLKIRIAMGIAALVLLQVVLILIPLWVWALYGMSDRVIDAWIKTNLLSFTVLTAGIAALSGLWVNLDE